MESVNLNNIRINLLNNKSNRESKKWEMKQYGIDESTIVKLYKAFPSLFNGNNDINQVDLSHEIHTPLMWAVVNDEKRLIDYLLENGADINKTDRMKRTPIILAVDKDFIDIPLIIYLAKKGAALNKVYSFHETMLDIIENRIKYINSNPYREDYIKLSNDLRAMGAKTFNELTLEEKNGKEQDGGKKSTRRRKHRSKTKKAPKKLKHFFRKG